MYTWRDLMRADVVIVPVNVFMNKSYRNVLRHYDVPSTGKRGLKRWSEYFAPVMKQQIGQGYDSFIEHKAVVKLEALFYHQIVFDEFHELGGLHGATQAICGSVKGSYC
jgi:hypothetical protein